MHFLDKEIPRLVALGVLQPSTSLYNNPPVLVPKGMTAEGKRGFRLSENKLLLPLSISGLLEKK